MSPAFRRETKELNDDARKSAGGSFVQLLNGITHYEMSGPETGDPVILIHGFSVPYFIYNPTFEFLVQSGFRVMRYDLFGRGFSDRPRARYNIDLFVGQLASLLDTLRFLRPVSLVGLSMGGLIASAFTVRHPDQVDKLILIDPAGVKPIALSPMVVVAKLPFIPEAIFSLVGSDLLVKGIANDFFDRAYVEHFMAQYKVQMQYKGFMRAILSTIRNGMLESFIHIYESLGKMDKRLLLFWGRQDVTVPFEHSNDLCAVLSNAEFHAIENCGHIPHYEKPEEVNRILLEFLT
jgi:pimeloyl-ACP methyl ester carboxylesterase